MRAIQRNAWKNWFGLSAEAEHYGRTDAASPLRPLVYARPVITDDVQRVLIGDHVYPSTTATNLSALIAVKDVSEESFARDRKLYRAILVYVSTLASNQVGENHESAQFHD